MKRLVSFNEYMRRITPLIAGGRVSFRITEIDRGNTVEGFLDGDHTRVPRYGSWCIAEGDYTCALDTVLLSRDTKSITLHMFIDLRKNWRD